MRTHHIALCLALLAATTVAAPAVASNDGAAKVIPSAGEIVRSGTLLDGPCSVTPPPVRNIQNWGPERNGTPYIGMLVYTEFYRLDSQGQLVSGSRHSVTPEPPLDPKWPACIYDLGGQARGVKAIDRGIWLMRVHRTRINKKFEFTGSWEPAAGDGTDAVTEIRFDVVSPNSCGNSEWVGLGPTDPSCFRQKEKQQAAALAQREQQDLQIEKPDYQSMCKAGKLNSLNYRSGQAGACIGYQLSIHSQENDSQANQRLAHDPPDSGYTTVTMPRPVALPDLSRLPAAWTAYRTLLVDINQIATNTDALVTAIERANGAYAATANSPAADQWTQRQNKAAYDIVQATMDLITDATDRLPEARGELLDAGLPEAAVDKLLEGLKQELDMGSLQFGQLL